MDLFGEDIVETIAEEASGTSIQDATFGEPDALDHPRKMTSLIGHDAIESQILATLQSGRIPHGLILSGAKGIGKATLAYRIARCLLKGGGFQSLDIPVAEPTYRKVASQGHPDLLTIERLYDAGKNKTAESLSVDGLRKVEPFLRMTSSDGGWRVVLIDDADTMNRNAQNALLKILEEPPKNTMIILITHRIGALIPTIRSRTQLIHVPSLSSQDLKTLLSNRLDDLSSEHQDLLIALSHHSFGRALELLEQGALESFESVINLLQNTANPDWKAIHALAEQSARAGQDQNYANITHNMLWIYESLAFAKARGRTLTPPILQQHAAALLTQSSLAQLLKICDTLRSHFITIKHSNLDKRQGIIGAFQILSRQS